MDLKQGASPSCWPGRPQRDRFIRGGLGQTPSLWPEPCQNVAYDHLSAALMVRKVQGKRDVSFEDFFFKLKMEKKDKESNQFAAASCEGLFLLSLCFPYFLSSPHVIVFCIKPP